jgi:hypothetical protein
MIVGIVPTCDSVFYSLSTLSLNFGDSRILVWNPLGLSGINLLSKKELDDNFNFAA